MTARDGKEPRMTDQPDNGEPDRDDNDGQPDTPAETESDDRTVSFRELRSRAKNGELEGANQERWNRMVGQLQEVFDAQQRRFNEQFRGVLDQVASIEIKNRIPDIKMPEIKMPEIKIPEIKITMPDIDIPGFGSGRATSKLKPREVTPGDRAGRYIVRLNRPLDRAELDAARLNHDGGWRARSSVEVQFDMLEDNADDLARAVRDFLAAISKGAEEIRQTEAEQSQRMNETANDAKRQLGIDDDE